MRPFLVLSCLVSLAAALVVQDRFEFQPALFTISEQDGYAIVAGKDMDFVDEPGCPMLPAMPVRVELPVPAHITAVSVRPIGWQPLATDVVPFPAQPQVILSRLDKVDRMMLPDTRVYNSPAPWPAKSWYWAGSGIYQGKVVAEVVLYPVRYVGLEKRLEFCPSFEVAVEFEPLPPKPELVQDEFEYVIITPNQFDTVFQRLAAWKTQKGVRAVVRDINWVLSNYPGRDNAERLRSYIKTLPDSGVEYVLLGGDVNLIPFRKAYAMTSDARLHSREDSLPCDLYFADLDGTWDANGNNVFGEVDDSVDLYPDMAVGRVPTANLADARAFVNKLLKYECAPSAAYLDNVLFFAEVMWTDPYTDGGVHKDRLERACFAAGHEVTKLYQRLGNESRTSVMAAMRAGQNFLNHDGHGWIDAISCGGSYLRTEDLDTITNTSHGILYSIGCWTTAFDYTSIGEAWVKNPNGGGVAMIGNSSYGWGSPGNPGFGYSDKFDDRFWWAIKREGIVNLGRALNWAKAWYAPFSRGRNVYRWHQYQVNLMGCPEMPVRTAPACSLRVTAPASIPLGNSAVPILVADRQQPVVGARVCLMKGTESYARGTTDAAGMVWLPVTPQTIGQFTLTVTAHNYYPKVITIPCVSGAGVVFAGWQVNDATGNQDGIANPGESPTLSLRLYNAGNTQSEPCPLVLRTAQPGIVILDSLAQAPALLPGESLQITDAFGIAVGAELEDGLVVNFELTAGSWQFSPVIQIGQPKLRFINYGYTSPPALPGTTEALRCQVRNSGHGIGHQVWARLISLDPHITVLAPESIMLGEIQPLTGSAVADSFSVQIAGTCPGSYRAAVQLQLRTEGYLFTDTFRLLIGNFGFSDDMESGEALWSHGGAGDLWHISEYRHWSGSHSWYCGDEVTHRYSNSMNCWLQTIPFMVAEHCSLKFWRWFSVPNYGVDGIYVIIMRRTAAETLDFIGTGGALGAAADGIESDWYQERYDLSWLPVGETISVRISFKSDADGNVGEGFYIDDVAVTGGTPPATIVLDPAPATGHPMQLSVHPNPFRRQVRLQLRNLPDRTAAIRVCDVAGREQGSFTVSSPAGYACWVWSGTDAAGRPLGSGTYFVVIRSGNMQLVKKLVKLE